MKIDRPIAIALILFAVLLLVFFLVVPEYKTFKKLRVELGEKTAEFNAKFDYYSAISKAYEDLKNRQDDLKKIDDALPADPELGRIIYLLQQIASENGMIVRDLFLSKSAPGMAQGVAEGSIRDISFSVNLLGSYSSLEKFMVALEKSSRLFEITNISFGSVSAGSSASSAASSSSSKTVTQSQLQSQTTTSFSLQVQTHSY